MMAGSVTAGSMTAAVLAVLASRPRKFWARYEVLAAMEDGRRFVGWALWRCVKARWVDVASDGRCEVWQRYRITAEGMRKIGRAR